MKYLIPALVFASFFAPSAQAEDILTLLEQKSKAKQPAPPKLNPYNYTVDVAISGEEGDKDEPPFTAKLRPGAQWLYLYRHDDNACESQSSRRWC